MAEEEGEADDCAPRTDCDDLDPFLGEKPKRSKGTRQTSGPVLLPPTRKTMIGKSCGQPTSKPRSNDEQDNTTLGTQTQIPVPLLQR
eukprot:12581790-Heterocapsa_arctica.AAC.1